MAIADFFTLHRTRRTSVGVLVLYGTDLVLENQMTLGGDLECSDGDCPTATKESLYDFEKNQMCPAGDGPPPGDDDGDVCAASVRVLCDLLRQCTGDQLRQHTSFYHHACFSSMPDAP